MCGICGEVYYKKKKLSSSGIKVMMKSIKHRGPDGEGHFIDRNVSLGHVRLSVIDTSKNASQPMFSKDGRYVIIFNGEIYNYQDIKEKLLVKGYRFKSSSDTEVLLKSYIEWGRNCLKRCNGVFSFVVYDKQNRMIFAARDRFGIKPFYYYIDSDKFLFGSEIKAILTDSSIKREVDEGMLYEFLVFNRTDHSVRTCFRNIKNLRPGHYLNLNSATGKHKIYKWYHLPQIKNGDRDISYYSRKLRKKLKESVSLHMVSDVPVGVALSGGLDSSVVAALMKNNLGRKVKLHSFSAVYAKSWEKNEKKYIHEVGEYLNLSTHYAKPTAKGLLNKLDDLIYCQEEPFHSASIFAGWCVYKKASESRIKVILNGQGSDEIFGYDYMAAFYFFELLKSFRILSLIKEIVLFWKKQKFGRVFTMQLFVFLISPKFMKNLLMSTSASIVAKEFFNKNRDLSNFYNIFFNVKSLNESVQNHLLYKLNHLLRVDDKNSMRHSVESRVPYLEKELIKFAFSIPSNKKIKNGESKYVLKDAMKIFVPKRIYQRNDKIGFDIPMDSWFRKREFVKYIDYMLKAKYQPMNKYLNLEYIRKKWDLHKKKKENNGKIIWKYIFLTRWYKIFFD